MKNGQNHFMRLPGFTLLVVVVAQISLHLIELLTD